MIFDVSLPCWIFSVLRNNMSSSCGAWLFQRIFPTNTPLNYALLILRTISETSPAHTDLSSNIIIMLIFPQAILPLHLTMQVSRLLHSSFFGGHKNFQLDIRQSLRLDFVSQCVIGWSIYNLGNHHLHWNMGTCNAWGLLVTVGNFYTFSKSPNSLLAQP